MNRLGYDLNLLSVIKFGSIPYLMPDLQDSFRVKLEFASEARR